MSWPRRFQCAWWHGVITRREQSTFSSFRKLQITGVFFCVCVITTSVYYSSMFVVWFLKETEIKIYIWAIQLCFTRHCYNWIFPVHFNVLVFGMIVALKCESYSPYVLIKSCIKWHILPSVFLNWNFWFWICFVFIGQKIDVKCRVNVYIVNRPVWQLWLFCHNLHK